jgi:tetratricopeptide (TPR) repeat protein
MNSFNIFGGIAMEEKHFSKKIMAMGLASLLGILVIACSTVHTNEYGQNFPPEEKAPSSNDILYLLASNEGLTALREERYSDAVQQGTDAINYNPNSHMGYFIRGLAYFFLSRDNMAFMDFDKAIQLNKTDAFNYYYRGVLYYGRGEIDKAKLDMRQYLKLYPDASKENTYQIVQEILRQ